MNKRDSRQGDSGSRNDLPERHHAKQVPSDPINILVIGITQSGKSTLIKKLRSLALNPGPEPEKGNKIGGGSLSATTDPFTYELDVPLITYSLVDSSTRTSIALPGDEETIFKKLWKRPDLEVVPEQESSDQLRLRLIDTPGLDDTRTNHSSKLHDAENVKRIMQHLKDLSEDEDPTKRYINCVLFVCHCSAPLSNSFQGWFDYYRRCFPNLFASLAVINTKFDIAKWEEEHRSLKSAIKSSVRKDSAKDQVMRARKESFIKLLNCEPKMFFIDNKPRRPFEEMMTRNTISDLLSYLKIRNQMPIGDICLPKLPIMTSIDLQLAGYLDSAQKFWENKRASLINSASDEAKQKAIRSAELLKFRAEKEECEKDLERLNNDKTYDLQTWHSHDDTSMPNRIWKGITFSRYQNKLIVEEKVWPFWVTAENTSVAWWTSTNFDDEKNTWTGYYKAKYSKVPKLQAMTWTKNRHIHADRIFDLQKRLRQLEPAIESAESSLEWLDKITKLEDANPELQQIVKWIGACEKLSKELKSDTVPLKDGFDSAALTRYAKSTRDISLSDLLAMLEARGSENHIYEALVSIAHVISS